MGFNHFRTRLGTFLQPLLEKTTRATTSMQINEEPVIVRRSFPEPSAFFGQPPSARECPGREEDLHDDDDDFDFEIANLFKGQKIFRILLWTRSSMRNRIFLWKVRGLAFATKSIFNALNNPRSSGAECLCSQRNGLSNQVPRIFYSSEFES